MSLDTKKRKNPNIHNPRMESCYVGKYGHVIGKHWNNDEISAMADDLLDWMLADNSHYWIEEFLLERKVPRSSFYALMAKHDYLKRVYELCRMRREMILAKASMFDDVNPSGVIFALKVKCGWSENGETEEKESVTIRMKPHKLADDE